MLRISLFALLISLSVCCSSGETSREKSNSTADKSSTSPDTDSLAALTMDAQIETPIVANARAELRVLGMT